MTSPKVMHTFELTSPKVYILLGFLCRKRVLACTRSGLFNLRLLFAPANCLEIVYQIRDFQGNCLNFWLFIKKSVHVLVFCNARIFSIEFEKGIGIGSEIATSTVIETYTKKKRKETEVYLHFPWLWWKLSEVTERSWS